MSYVAVWERPMWQRLGTVSTDSIQQPARSRGSHLQRPSRNWTLSKMMLSELGSGFFAVKTLDEMPVPANVYIAALQSCTGILNPQYRMIWWADYDCRHLRFNPTEELWRRVQLVPTQKKWEHLPLTPVYWLSATPRDSTSQIWARPELTPSPGERPQARARNAPRKKPSSYISIGILKE